MSNSEKKIVKEIRKWLGQFNQRYDFWFVYDDNGNAIGWEGGTRLLRGSIPFRNEYSVACKGSRVVDNYPELPVIR